MKQTEKIRERVAKRKKMWEEDKKRSSNPNSFGKPPGSRNPKKLKSARAEGERGKIK